MLIEDNPDIAFGLRMNLEIDGFSVDWAPDGGSALSCIDTTMYNLIILDLLLPDTSGYELLKQLRESNQTRPIVVLSALQEESNKVLAFRLGADDYVTKPFGVMELIERIKARLRACGETDETKAVLTCGELRVDTNARRVYLTGEEVSLTPKEFSLMCALLSANEGVVTRKKLLLDVWNLGAGVDTRTVEQHVQQLRRKFAQFGFRDAIRTIHKEGFALDRAKLQS